MSNSEQIIRCKKLTKKLLIKRKEATGHSIPTLLEYAVLNMPYIAPKKMKNDKQKR